MIFEAILSFRDKWKLLQKHFEFLTRQSLRLALARTRHERRFFRIPRRGPQETEFGLAWGGFVDFLVIPKDSDGDSWGLSQNFKTSNGSLKTIPTSIRGRLWKLRFLGPDRPSAGPRVISKGPEGVSQVTPRRNP